MNEEEFDYRDEVLDLRGLKGECEEKIHAILDDFTTKTGLRVDCINLNTYEIPGMCAIKYIPKLEVKL